MTDTTAQLVVLVARQPPAVFTADRRAALKHANGRLQFRQRVLRQSGEDGDPCPMPAY